MLPAVQFFQAYLHFAGVRSRRSRTAQGQAAEAGAKEPLEEELDQDYEALDETAEEWGHDEPAATAFRV